MSLIYGFVGSLFFINTLYNVDKYILFGFQPDQDHLQARIASNSSGFQYIKCGLYTVIQVLCIPKLSFFLYLKRKANDYGYFTFVGLGFHEDFENSINLLNYTVIP